MPTAIPENLAITAPATAESATAVAFGNSTGALAGLKYQWDFGDGSTSTDAAPSHSFASGGEFEVVLKVTNEAGSSRETRAKLSITNIANVRGLECSGPANTGWCWQNPKPTGNRINTVYFLNASTGWRGGDSGDIFKTIDSGVTWVRQNSGITASIRGIRFLNTTTGWVTAASGIVLRTADGGSTWAAARLSDESSVGPVDVATITAVDARTVYVGRAGTGSASDSNLRMYASKDGGATWQSMARPATVVTATGKLWALQDKTVSVSTDGGQTYTAVLTLDLPTGHDFGSPRLQVLGDQRAVAYANASAFDRATQTWSYFQSIYTTTDGGASWSSRADSPSDSTMGGILSMSADGKVLLAGNDKLTRSTDGGRTWTVVPSPSSAQLTYYASLPGGEILSSNLSGLWMSKDGAQTWTRLGNPTGGYDTALYVRRVEANTLQVGLLLSKDDGQSWASVFQLVDISNSSKIFNVSGTVAFIDAKTGFLSDGSGGLFTTKDGGANWVVKNLALGKVRAVQFVGKQTGWLVGADERLYKSTDAGQNWAPVTAAAGLSFRSVHFENEALGWSGRGWDGGAPFAATRDGGKTWTELALPARVASLRQGEQSWVAVGGVGPVYVSTDAGGTWKTVEVGTSAYLTAVAFSDARTVWAVGSASTLLKSADAGASWTAVTLPVANATLNGIRFANAKVGWIIGWDGLILATQDGGKTWRQQVSGASVELSSIEVVDSNTAWITGDSGTVLATGSGGN
ncbi:MAG: PKD domain-containing protein [Pelomonas sp.]|nr:PKD domain-containing protein [Roseateles sp.]